MKNEKLRCVLLAAGVALAFGRCRADGHAETTTWFDEDYSGHAEVSDTQWTTTAGTWTKQSTNDQSACSEELGRIRLCTGGEELSFKPTAAKPVNSLVRTECKVAFTACSDNGGWLCDPINDQQGALGLRPREDGKGLTFFGWHMRWRAVQMEGAWSDLSAPGLEPEEGKEYTVTVEIDQSCLPTRIRYSIDGVPLADASGATWLNARSTVRPWEAGSNKRMTGVSFRGLGEVGEIVATQAGAREARAKVEVGRPTQMTAGSELAFSAEALAGKVLGENVTCRWYREDAAGVRAEASLGEGEKYAITEADYGHWISADVSDEDGFAGSGRVWCSKLPVAYIDVEPDEQGSVWPRKHGKDYAATLLLAGNAQYKKQYEGAITMHVRGNSTSNYDKKPYKIKLDKKTDLFGFGNGTKNKHWVMLASVNDESLMRNKVAMDLSKELGVPAAMKSEWVDVVMNGQFVGNYLLCQHIRVGEDRVNVYNWGDAAEKIAEKSLEANPALTEDDQKAIEDVLETNCGWMSTGRFAYLGTNYAVKTKGTAGVGPNGVTVVWKKFTTDTTGGYLFDIDNKKTSTQYGGTSPDVCSFIQTNQSDLAKLILHVGMNTPEYAFVNNEAISNFVWDTWWNAGQAWISGTCYNGAGQHYRDLCDFDSMVGYWLSLYVMANNDAAACSRYSYMDQGGKMIFGPAWDFDYGAGSPGIRQRMPYVTNEAGRVRYAPADPTGWIPGGSAENFMGHWTADPYFSWKVREKYLEMRPRLAELVRDGGTLDQYMTNLLESAQANDIRWATRIGFMGDAYEPGDALVLKDFLTRRLEWLDGQMTNVAATVENLTQTIYVYQGWKLRYVRNPNLAITFDGVKPMEDSPEVDMTDVRTVRQSSESVTVRVTVPKGQTAAAVKVYVNGCQNATWPVSAGQATGTIAVADLVRGARNLIGCDAVDASGNVLSRNVALICCDKQGTVLFVQ